MLTIPILCLALNIYFEAQGESLAGQIAVSQVVLNRVKSPEYPNSICKVITERKQFSWYWDGKSDTPKNTTVLIESIRVATIVYNYPLIDITNGALFYHADWIKEKHIHTNPVIIGQHIFYREEDQ